MKIRAVRHNNRKNVFEVGTSTKTLVFPFSKAVPTPTTEDPVTEVSVDPEAGREAFTYVLHSGRTGPPDETNSEAAGTLDRGSKRSAPLPREP